MPKKTEYTGDDAVSTNTSPHHVLTQIQYELKVPKGNFNSFGKYKYRSAEDILEAVKPILYKHNATLTISDNLIALNSKVYMESTATLVVGGETYVVKGYAETDQHKGMSAEQTTGTASSYARKYALNGLFLIDETQQDADSQNNSVDTQKKTALKKEVLTTNHPNWDKVVKALSGNLNTIQDVEIKYDISEVREMLTNLKLKN